MFNSYLSWACSVQNTSCNNSPSFYFCWSPICFQPLYSNSAVRTASEFECKLGFWRLQNHCCVSIRWKNWAWKRLGMSWGLSQLFRACLVLESVGEVGVKETYVMSTSLALLPAEGAWNMSLCSSVLISILKCLSTIFQFLAYLVQCLMVRMVSEQYFGFSVMYGMLHYYTNAWFCL